MRLAKLANRTLFVLSVVVTGSVAGAFVWALLVCMVGAFLIAEAYITTFNLPVLGISAVAALGVILILTAIFSGRSKKSRGSQSTSAADAIRTQ